MEKGQHTDKVSVEDCKHLCIQGETGFELLGFHTERQATDCDHLVCKFKGKTGEGEKANSTKHDHIHDLSFHQGVLPCELGCPRCFVIFFNKKADQKNVIRANWAYAEKIRKEVQLLCEEYNIKVQRPLLNTIFEIVAPYEWRYVDKHRRKSTAGRKRKNKLCKYNNIGTYPWIVNPVELSIIQDSEQRDEDTREPDNYLTNTRKLPVRQVAMELITKHLLHLINSSAFLPYTKQAIKQNEKWQSNLGSQFLSVEEWLVIKHCFSISFKNLGVLLNK